MMAPNMTARAAESAGARERRSEEMADQIEEMM